VSVIKSSIGVGVLLYGLALSSLVGTRVYGAQDGGVFSSTCWRLRGWCSGVRVGSLRGQECTGAKVVLGWAFFYSEPAGVCYSTAWGAGALRSTVWGAGALRSTVLVCWSFVLDSFGLLELCARQWCDPSLGSTGFLELVGHLFVWGFILF
jgi:hypothetical protein